MHFIPLAALAVAMSIAACSNGRYVENDPVKMCANHAGLDAVLDNRYGPDTIFCNDGTPFPSAKWVD